MRIGLNVELTEHADGGGMLRSAHATAVFRRRSTFELDAVYEIAPYAPCEFRHFAKLVRAIEKHLPTATFFVGGSDSDLACEEIGRLRDELDALMMQALRVLRVGGEDRSHVHVDEGSMGGDYRKTLYRASWYGERYLVGRSLMQHHEPYTPLREDQGLREVADELVFAMRSVGYSTRDGGSHLATLRLAVTSLGNALETYAARPPLHD